MINFSFQTSNVNFFTKNYFFNFLLRKCMATPLTSTGQKTSFKIARPLRSSHRRCSVRKCVLRNFAKLTGKNLCQSFFFKKVAGLRPSTLLKRDPDKCFPVNFAKFLRTLFLKNTSGQLLLIA